MNAELFFKSDDTLGEGALYDPAADRIFWVDILGQKLKSVSANADACREYTLPGMVSTVVREDEGHVIVALDDRLARLDTSAGVLTTLTPVEADLPENRCNDGKCDPTGRLWFGTMSLEGKPHAGKLYTFGRGEKLQVKLDRQSVPNGIVWHGDKMYYIDTADRCIREFGFDLQSGGISKERIAVTVPEELGSPDGMAADSAGMLWVALWGGGAVGCWDPATGHMIAKIEVDAPLVTSCAFGGPGRRSLFITTARFGMTSEEIAAAPLSGSLFVCRQMPAAGLESNSFKL